jgi:UDP-GlcNAc:undecaprenyl-phosphate/decaprenyl-phosphate GlcNAc-1-phosphate transferase
MNTYLALFVIALSSSLFLTPVVRRMAQRLGWLDVPQDDRRLHVTPIPRVGGIAIFLSVAVALGSLPFLDNLVTQGLRARSAPIAAVFISSTIVFLFGVFDDLVGASARWKFLVQGIAGTVLYALGGKVGAISIPFAGSVELPAILSFGITIVWVVGISNAYNLIDGMDGLAAGASLFAALVMLGVSFMLGNPFVTVVSIVFAGALIGFLRYNFNPASIFLGDSGSLFIGFTLAALSVTSSQKASTVVAVAIPLMAFGLPVIDTGFAIARRFIAGRPLFQGDREHIHHKLLERGWSQRRVAFVLYGVCALFGMIALLFVSDSEGRMTGLLLLIVGAAVILVAGRLRYHEMDEVKASVRRNIGERRIRAANHVRIRKSAHAMQQAQTLAELFAAVRQKLELAEFVYATVQLGQADEPERNRLALEQETDPRFKREARIRDGIIHWDWERGDIEGHEIIGSDMFWTLRLPLCTKRGNWGYVNFYGEFGGDGLLMDVNYLNQIFQSEMAAAVERILERVQTASSKESLPMRAAL